MAAIHKDPDIPNLEAKPRSGKRPFNRYCHRQQPTPLLTIQRSDELIACLRQVKLRTLIGRRTERGASVRTPAFYENAG